MEQQVLSFEDLGQATWLLCPRVFKHDIGDERRLNAAERLGQVDEVQRFDTREEGGEVQMWHILIAVLDAEVALVCVTNAKRTPDAAISRTQSAYVSMMIASAIAFLS